MQGQKPPLFIIGSGRSGSTVFFEMFTEHPDVAWMTPFVSRFPSRPYLNRWLLDSIDQPVIGPIMRNNPLLKRTTEAYPFWNLQWRGFSRPHHDLTAKDVTPVNRKRIRKALAELTTSRRSQLLVKLTGWPRLRFLREIYPDAKFIHIVRDGRAVANSYLKMPWWTGWEGPNSWIASALSPEQRELWAKYDYSDVALAGLNWVVLMQAVEAATAELDDDTYCLISYSDLCATPIETFQQAIKFCGLRWTSDFEARLRATELHSANDKWQNDLTAAQQEVLEAITHDYLVRYGYER